MEASIRYALCMCQSWLRAPSGSSAELCAPCVSGKEENSLPLGLHLSRSCLLFIWILVPFHTGLLWQRAYVWSCVFSEVCVSIAVGFWLSSFGNEWMRMWDKRTPICLCICLCFPYKHHCVQRSHRSPLCHTARCTVQMQDSLKVSCLKTWCSCAISSGCWGVDIQRHFDDTTGRNE